MTKFHNEAPILKTLGPRSAVLITSLYDEKKTLFTSEDASRITGLSGNTLNVLLGRLVRKGITTRLKSGLYNIVPSELGSESHYVSDPASITESLVQQKGLTENDYYISHGTAFELHQMVTQPQLSHYCSVTKRLPQVNLHGFEFNFHQCKKKEMFGIEKIWISKNKAVRISDIEKTIIDGLKQPQYCGGIIEVAKALWIKKDVLDIKKLLNYAFVMDSGVVFRRLGFLLELIEIGKEEEREILRAKLTNTYALLDPELFQEGKFQSKWKLRLNVSAEEIKNAIRN